jgi:predicted DCC family thiol-disulfide oxidoreductase YuxK
MASWHLAEHPEISSGGAAFSGLFRLLPGGTLFALVAERFPGAADKGYRWVADRRGVFGRLVAQPMRRWADRVIQVSESAADSR